MQNVAERRAQEKITPATGDVVKDIGSYFPWVERDALAVEVYQSQLQKWRKALENQKYYRQVGLLKQSLQLDVEVNDSPVGGA